MSAAESAAPPSDDSGPSVEELVRHAQGGDGAAFNQLVRRYAGRVTRLVARFVRSEADLAEVAQDVFVKAHRGLGSFRAESPFEHWLLRIATRRCHDYLRAQYRRRWFTSFDHLQDQGFEPATSAAEETDPRLPALRAAVRRLRPDDRTVITLLELEEHSVREVAALTGWTESKVKVRAHRARRALRRDLESFNPPPL